MRMLPFSLSCVMVYGCDSLDISGDLKLKKQNCPGLKLNPSCKGLSSNSITFLFIRLTRTTRYLNFFLTKSYSSVLYVRAATTAMDRVNTYVFNYAFPYIVGSVRIICTAGAMTKRHKSLSEFIH